VAPKAQSSRLATDKFKNKHLSLELSVGFNIKHDTDKRQAEQ